MIVKFLLGFCKIRIVYNHSALPQPQQPPNVSRYYYDQKGYSHQQIPPQQQVRLFGYYTY